MAYKPGSAIAQAKNLIGVQLSSSLVTFIFNTLIARTVGPEIFGIANVDFYVVYSAAQFLSREYVRKSSIIYTKNCKLSQRAMEREIFSLGWWAVFVSICISSLIYYLFGHNREHSIDSAISPSIYSEGILLYTLSGLIEMFAEPFILIANIRVWSYTISKIEAFGLFLKCIVSLISIKFFVSDTDPDGYLLSFACSQLFASIIVVGIWITMFMRMVESESEEKQNKKSDKKSDNKLDEKSNKKSDEKSKPETGFMTVRDILPSVRHNVDSKLVESSMMFFFQSVIKFGLTEGEKIVMIGLQIDATTQGIYSLVSNLGSLVARYGFAQIEKTAHTEFSKLDVTKNRKVITEILETILKMVTIVALLCLVFAPNYSFMALDVLYGEKWSHTEAPKALSRYCWYLLFLSINGITEAFVQSETPSKYYQMFLVMVTIVYWIAVAYFMQWGVSGLIAANCINMVLRIGYNCWFIRKQIPLTEIFTIFRSYHLFVILLLARMITGASNMLLVMDKRHKTCGGVKIICYILHAGSAATSLALVALVIWWYERDFWTKVKRLVTVKED